MAVVVDAFAVEDPFFGHGHLIKGRLLQAQGQPADALEYFKLALQAYRYHSIICMPSLHQHANVLQQIKQTSKLACVSLQDMLSALLCKPSERLVPRYRNSLLELESHFEGSARP